MLSRDGEGPAGSAAAWKFMRRAYPAKDISLAKIEGARAAHAAHMAKDFASSDATSGALTWVSLGPTQALYPLSPFRNATEAYAYVPAAYLAGGRTTALAIDPACSPSNCRLWATPASGGVWRTNDALKTQPDWTYLSGSFGINAVGSVQLDPNNSDIVWVGTGEANQSSSEAGVGLYKSTDGGDSWSRPIGKNVFNSLAIGSIAIDPSDSNTIYVATDEAVRGISSVAGGTAYLIPGAPPWGLYKSTDGGASWSLIFDGASSTVGCNTSDYNLWYVLTPCSPVGVRRVVSILPTPTSSTLRPMRQVSGARTMAATPGIRYSYRSPTQSPQIIQRPEIAVTKLPNGNTRMYLVIGQFGDPPAQTFISNNVATGTPNFFPLSSKNPASPGYATYNSCTGQCFYDSFVYTPPGNPDIVYIGGLTST